MCAHRAVGQITLQLCLSHTNNLAPHAFKPKHTSNSSVVQLGAECRVKTQDDLALFMDKT